MSIWAFCSIMTKILQMILLLGKRAPNSFILLDIEFIVFWLEMNQLYHNLVLCMSKRAEFFILTILNIVWIRLAKLTFVSTWVIKLFYFVVRVFTILWGTFVSSANKVIILIRRISSFISIVMVEQTCFSLMLI